MNCDELLPYSDSRPSKTYIEFPYQLIQVGEAKMVARAKAVEDGDARDRFAVGLEIQKALRGVLRDNETEDPLFSLSLSTVQHLFVAQLSYLPGFYRPSRLFVLLCNLEDIGTSPFSLTEIMHAAHPVLSHLDPSQFNADFRIRSDDLVGFRDAVRSIVQKRMEATSTKAVDLQPYLFWSDSNFLS